MRTFFFCISLALTTGLIGQTTSVTFRVNMNEQTAQSKFDPGTEFVDLAGTFNSWGSTPLSDADADGIYTASVSLTVGAAIEFKARINGEWNGREEFPGGGSNRSYTVEANGVVEFWYNDEVSSNVLSASFLASGRRILPGQVVQFTDQSNGSPVSWEWSFPGGNPDASAEQNPIVTYSAEGTYTVSLVVTDAVGATESITKTDYIRVSTEVDASWWNDAVFYEIFVRSFYDQNGDGKGDFKGLIEKLDYLNDGNPATHTDLGVTGIWLMPIHQSPSYHGYDVTDYRTIESDYGTNADFKAFVAAAHERGIRVIIDYVMNHSSSSHPWFLGSKSKGSNYRNWYRWSDTNPGGTGPWGQTVWHSSSGSYYYGLFWDGMPDLNYATPEVKTEMFDIATYWLSEMEVDGFRLDAVKYIYETGTKLEDTEETFEFFKDFRAHYKAVNMEALAVGEAWTSTDKVVKYVEDDRLDFCFEFDLASAILNATNSGSASGLKNQIEEVMVTYPYLQFGTFLTNHDQNRVMDVLGNGEEKAKLAAQLLLSFPGVPFLYYGEEIGMNGSKPDEDIRLPLQWSSEAKAGFTTGTPWRNPKSDFTEKNIESQQQDHQSLWHVYRQMIRIRNQEIALRRGNYESVSLTSTSALAFLRQFEEEAIIVAANLSQTPVEDMSINMPASELAGGTYTLVDLLSGTTHELVVSGDGGFTSQSIGDLAARSIALYKLLDPSATTASVSFHVDMSEMITNGFFDPASETVDLVSDVNDWGATLIPMEDTDEDLIYSGLVSTLPIGSGVYYKYRLNGVTDERSEYAFSSKSRKFIVQDGANEVLDVYRMSAPLGFAGSSENSLLAYPNPASESVTLRLPGGSSMVDFSITDLAGRLVKVGSLNGSLTISIADLPSGIYLLSANVEGRLFSAKVLVSR